MVRLCARQQTLPCKLGLPGCSSCPETVSRVLLLLVSVDIRTLSVVRGVFFSGALSLLLKATDATLWWCG